MNITALEQQNKEKEAIVFLESIGYQVLPEAKQLMRSQEVTAERYPLSFLKERFNYNNMVLQEPSWKDLIDTFFHYLYNAVNSTKDTIRINGEEKQQEVVISTLLKLEHFDFLYAIGKYKENTGKVHNHGAYILTLLYNAKAQHEADITNQVQHDLYG